MKGTPIALIAGLILPAFLATAQARDQLHEERQRSARTGLVLAKSETSYIHLLARGAPGYSPGHNILHTVRDTGEMRILYSSGITDELTVHLTWSFRAILGLVVHEGYLYVADVGTGQIPYGERDSTPRPHTQADLHQQLNGKQVMFSVHVFSVETGQMVGTDTFPALPPGASNYISDSKKYKGISPYECLSRGPLSQIDGRLQCFNHRFTIESGVLEVKEMEDRNTEQRESTVPVKPGDRSHS